jgi:hypothetical protein
VEPASASPDNTVNFRLQKSLFSSTQGDFFVATYECKKCGMSVNATCAHCDAPLENDNLKLDNGTEVQISKCPNGHGKIKSPMCCGQDMSCSIG